MIRVFNGFRELNFSQLCNVYVQSSVQIGKEQLPDASKYEQRLYGEQVLYDQLYELFYHLKGICAVWTFEGEYKTALRVLKYRDGYLISGLETAPEARNHGYAERLLAASCLYMHDLGCNTLYSHVDKRNFSALQVHFTCGFERIQENAAMLDGSVMHSYCTLVNRI